MAKSEWSKPVIEGELGAAEDSIINTSKPSKSYEQLWAKTCLSKYGVIVTEMLILLAILFCRVHILRVMTK